MTTLGSMFKGGKVYVAPLPFDLGKTVLEVTAALGRANLAASAVGGDALGSPAALAAAITAWTYQDDDAHEDCSLVACLNPLHPGPCKGWKGTLHEVSPGAWHAIESARVEKANANRIKKIQALKAEGKPIPHKLLQPILPKSSPQAGKTAKNASGEAHAASNAITESSGIKPSSPGKVTLGLAVKPVGPAQKGPKGKKPTLGSKGIAFVIGQEKVTPQYKLDKAAGITPEQWANLPEGDQSAIRGELTKIKKDGFGPQQKKADELLAKLPAGAQPDKAAPAPEVAQTPTPGVDKAAAAKLVKAELDKQAAAGPSGQKAQAVKDEMAKGSTLAEAIKKVTAPTAEHAAAGPTDANQGAAMKAVGEAVYGPMSQPASAWAEKVKGLKTKGPIEEQHGFKAYVNAIAQAALKKAMVEKMPGLGHGTGQAGITEFNHEIADHIKEGKPGLPPLLEKMVANSDAAKAGLPKTATPHEEKVKEVEAKLAEATAKLEAHDAKHPPKGAPGTPSVSTPAAPASSPTKLSEVSTPSTAVHASDGSLGTMSPLAITKIMDKEGSAHLLLGGKTIEVGFQGKGKEGTLTFIPGLGKGTGHYVVTTKDGEKYQIGKGEQLKVMPKPATLDEIKAIPKPEKLSAAETPKALPKHVEDAISMANGQAPGASWSKNHLAAYEKLSAEEFNGLPPETRTKITDELNKATTKFLDPKKVVATKELLAKFGHGAGPKASPPKIENVDFAKDISNHAVTPAQAKQAAEGAKISAHFFVAKDLAGVTDAENPDADFHVSDSLATAQALLDLKTKYLMPEVLNQPGVPAAMKAFKTAAAQQALIESVKDAKQKAFNKVATKTTKGADQLSPIEKASLLQYSKHLLQHPTNTQTAHVDALKAATKTAEDDLNDKLKTALKAVNAGPAASMSPTQIEDRAKELLGPYAHEASPFLDLPETKLAKANGQAQAIAAAEKFAPATLADPAVAAKYQQYVHQLTQANMTQQMKAKVDAHIAATHTKALSSGLSNFGEKLTPADRKVIEAHAENLKAKYAHLDNSAAQLTAEADTAKSVFVAAADKVEGAGTNAKLTDFDRTAITSAYSQAWSTAASAVVVHGIPSYVKKEQMKANPEYPLLTQDLGKLRDLSGQAAVARAEEHTAGLNVPTDENGDMEHGSEYQAWLTKSAHADNLAAQFKDQLATAQKRLDIIRTSAGLKKRALPKLDAPAIKAAAAESGHYKSGGYGGPNWQKGYASKSNYMLAKVGPKLAVVHKSAAEKKLEKLGSTAPKPAKVAYVAPPTSQPTKDKFPTTAVAGSSPNKAAAEKFGFTHTDTVQSASHSWVGDGKPAYVVSAEQQKATEAYLTNPDTKFGLGAQKEFKWSINNMESKGASSSHKGSLYSYTGSGYTAVNSKLNSLPPGAKKTGSTSVSNIDNGIAASPPLESDVVLYRGFHNPHSVFSSGKWNDVNVAGMEWSQRSYSSTSGTLSTAQSFGSGGVVMRLIIPKEMQVKGINAKGGQHAGENEVILQRGLRYRVVADYGKHSGTRYIDVMVVPSPYDKAE